eukprot:scaffold599156_cov15-Prasinocladus_malaysianus.AAC.1
MMNRTSRFGIPMTVKTKGRRRVSELLAQVLEGGSTQAALLAFLSIFQCFEGSQMASSCKDYMY